MYSNVCNKYRKSKKTKISYIFKKTLSLSIVYRKCGHECEKIFKKVESIKILKILGFKGYLRYKTIFCHKVALDV